MNVSIFLLFIILTSFISTKTDARSSRSCTKSIFYFNNEQNNRFGPGVCENECDCDRRRRCNPFNKCENCAYLSETWPFRYPKILCF